MADPDTREGPQAMNKHDRRHRITVRVVLLLHDIELAKRYALLIDPMLLVLLNDEDFDLNDVMSYLRQYHRYNMDAICVRMEGDIQPSAELLQAAIRRGVPFSRRGLCHLLKHCYRTGGLPLLSKAIEKGYNLSAGAECFELDESEARARILQRACEELTAADCFELFESEALARTWQRTCKDLTAADWLELDESEALARILQRSCKKPELTTDDWLQLQNSFPRGVLKWVKLAQAIFRQDLGELERALASVEREWYLQEKAEFVRMAELGGWKGGSDLLHGFEPAPRRLSCTQALSYRPNP